jgi:hypothetical protein
MRALDRDTVLASMESEGTLVDECIELPYPTAEPSLVDQVTRLGISVPDHPTKPECVFEVLSWCARNQRVASISYLTDLEGRPWRTSVEPHGFRRSKEGFRLRCYRPAAVNDPDVVSDFQTDGWHLYLIEDIEWAEATPSSFHPRPYSRSHDEVSISISFRS